MSLNERIEKEYIDAYRAKDQVKLGTLRLLKTAIKNRLVELKRAQGKLDDGEILDVITKQAKQRKDSIEQYLAANRPDLAEKEKKELEALREYLPKALNAEELAQAVSAAIAETKAATIKDMGKVMGLVMAKYKGQVDGNEVSAAVRRALGAS